MTIKPVPKADNYKVTLGHLKLKVLFQRGHKGEAQASDGFKGRSSYWRPLKLANVITNVTWWRAFDNDSYD